MSAYAEHADVKARDALAFEPLPDSRWASIDDRGIVIAVRYSEPLSRLLRALRGARWEAEHRRWRYPFASAEQIRAALPEIERLAAAAHESAEQETQRRRAEQTAFAQERAAMRRETERRRALATIRPLAPDHLYARPDRPRFALTLEAIGDNGGWPPRCSVQRVFATDGRGGWVRAWLTGAKDYADANSVGSRGVTYIYLLEEGPIYEINAPRSWRHTEHFFAHVVDGELRRLSATDLLDSMVS